MNMRKIREEILDLSQPFNFYHFLTLNTASGNCVKYFIRKLDRKPGVSLSVLDTYTFHCQAVCRPVVRSTYSATKALGKCAIKK
jgi:hypothetical protein